MSSKKQWQRTLGLKAYISKVGSTADRSTEADDIRVNDHAWKMDKWVYGPRCPRMRADIIA